MYFKFNSNFKKWSRLMVSGRLLKKNYRTSGIKQGSHQCTCVHILHKNGKKRHTFLWAQESQGCKMTGHYTHTSLQPSWKSPCYMLYQSPILSTQGIVMSTQKTQPSTTKITHSFSIWHKRKTDVDPQIVCLQVHCLKSFYH